MADLPPDLAATRARLSARLADLKARGARVDAGLETPLSTDFDDAATESEDFEPLEGESRVLAAEAREVAAAIARIDAATYGDCVRCGEAIAPARLAAEPEAALCIACASDGRG